MNAVTTLIGLSYEEKAYCGAIGKYYDKSEDEKYLWNPRCYFGCVDINKIYTASFLNGISFQEVKPNYPEDHDRYKIQ